MPNDDVDESRVRACAHDPDALAEVFRVYGADVRSFLMRISSRSAVHEVEDLTQEVFLAVPDAARRYRGDAPPRAWLFGIARRMARSRARRAAVRRALLLQRPAEVEPVARDGGLETGLDLERAMERLSDTHREVLVLSVVEGLSARELAVALGVKEKTVWTRVHRARRALAELLEADEPLNHSGGDHGPDRT